MWWKLVSAVKINEQFMINEIRAAWQSLPKRRPYVGKHKPGHFALQSCMTEFAKAKAICWKAEAWSPCFAELHDRICQSKGRILKSTSLAILPFYFLTLLYYYKLEVSILVFCRVGQNQMFTVYIRCTVLLTWKSRIRSYTVHIYGPGQP